MKKFEIPTVYRSPIISKIKEYRKGEDKLKKDFQPTSIDFGSVRFHLARHFGFCYGVENAIEIVYRVIQENPNRRIFLLSEMIHNPKVNQDLLDEGIQFLNDTLGNELVSWDSLTKEDIIVVPAFGTTIETFEKIKKIGLESHQYNTTCPFVEKVWKRAKKLGEDNSSIIIHGKRNHEETRATFSHAQQSSPTLIVQNLQEAEFLAEVIKGTKSIEEFTAYFAGYYSEAFDPNQDLKKIGVINQTTMLATETQYIADFLKQAVVDKYGKEEVSKHFADTRDTLCYATSDNQGAVYGMLEREADFALVIGGYNSSNTSHLVELCEEKLPTYFISCADKIISKDEIEHFDYHSKKIKTSYDFIPQKDKVEVLITSGASCPDAIVEEVMVKLKGLFNNTISEEAVLERFE